MFSNINKKTAAIFGVGVVLIAIMAIVFLSSRKPEQPNNVVVDPPVTGTGGFTDVEPSPVYDLRGNLIVKTDPTKPYSSITPRSDEPIASSASGQQPVDGEGNVAQDFDDYRKAIIDGIIPDANGMYKVVVDPSGLNQYQRTAFNYNLTGDQFISTYYPDAPAVLSNSTAAQLQRSSKDPLVIEPVQAAASSSEISVLPDVPLDSLNINNNSDTSAIQKYAEELSAATEQFDLVYDSTLLQQLLNAESESELTSLGEQAVQTINSVRAVSVPRNMIGLSQSYILLYESYVRIVNDANSLQLVDPSQQNALLQQIIDEVELFNQYMELVQSGIGVLAKYF